MGNHKAWKKKDNKESQPVSRWSKLVTKKRPKKEVEKPWGPKKTVEKPWGQKKKVTLAKYTRKAKKVEADPQSPTAYAISQLKGNKKISEQKEVLATLEVAVISILTKLARKGVDIEKLRDADELGTAVTESGITLTGLEPAALANLDRIASETGPTATEVKNSWPDQIKTAQKNGGVPFFEGLANDYKGYLNEHPYVTPVVTIIGVMGLGFMSHRVYKWIFEKRPIKAAGKGAWSRKTVMMVASLLALGGLGYIKKDKILKILAKNGIDPFDLKDKVENGKKLTKNTKKKLKKVGKEIGDEIERKRKAKKAKRTLAVDPGDYEEPTPVPGALEPTKKAKETQLKKFGDKLLREKKAHNLGKGSWLITTGKRNVWFKFDKEEGKWKWQSETEKEDKEWIDCGADDYYDEEKYPDTVEVNTIARRLGRASGAPESKEDEAARKKGKTSDLTKRGAEVMEASKYDGAKKAFIAVYFNPRFHKKDVFNWTVDNISQVKFAKIKALVSKHKASEKISKDELQSIKSDISEEHLFLLLQKMVSFSKLGRIEGDPDKVTVQLMLESVMSNPMADQLDGMNEAVVDALKEGDIGDALIALAKQGKENLQSKASKMAERLNNVMGISVEHLNKNEKNVYQRMQILLMVHPTLVKREPKDVIDDILKTHSKFRAHPKAVKLATKFFTEVKKRAPAPLEKAVKKFEIEKPGKINHLREGVNMGNLHFLNACELLLLDQAIEGEGDQATNLLILGVLIRSIRQPRLKEPYIGLLTMEVKKDVPSINIPGLKSLQPYFEKAIRVAGAHIGYQVLDFFSRYSVYQDEHPTHKSHEEMAEAFKNQNIVFGSIEEAWGTTLELSSDALAAIVLAMPDGVRDGLASCNTGKEFLDLIRVHGGHTVPYRDADGTLGILIDTGTEVLLARPGAILWESTKSLFEFSPGGAWDATKIWIGGSAFFVTAGSLRGFFKTCRGPQGRTIFALRTRVINAFKGKWWGLQYPIKAPIFAYDIATTGIKGLATGAEGISSMARAPFRAGRRALNWTRDVIRYKGLPGQNIENMVDTGRLLEEHFKSAETKGNIPIEADLASRAGRAWRRGKALIREPKATLRQMTAGDWHWEMSKKFSKRLAIQYNDLFRFDENSGFNVDELNTHAQVQKVVKASEGLTRFLKHTQENPKLLEQIVELAKAEKGTTLRGKLITLLENKGLDPNEVEGLANRIKNEKMARRITNQIKRAAARSTGAKLVEAGKPGALARLRERLGGKPVLTEAELAKRMPKATFDALKNPKKLGTVKIAGETYRYSDNGVWQRQKGLSYEGNFTTEELMEKAATGLPRLGADVTTPKALGGSKYRYMGEEFSLSNNEIDDMAKKMKVDSPKAIEELCRKKWNTPRFVSKGPHGKLYRYRGGEFVLNPAEYRGADAKGIAKIIDAKYAESIRITSVRVVKGAAEFKVNGEWIKAPKGPGAMAKVRADYVKAAKSAGYGFEYQDLKNTRLLKHWPVLKEMLGPVTAVAIIYHLETAQDKRKAIAETAVGLGAFMATGKGMERGLRNLWQPKSILGNVGKGGVIFLASLGAAVGVTEPISSVLEDLVPKFAGDQQITLEAISFFEKATTRGISLKVLRKLQTEAGKEILKKKGLKTVGKLLAKKIESTVLKKIIVFTSKSLMGKLAVSLGARGAILAVLVADDATVIGVLDDVVAVGMAAWMAKDIYDVAVLARNALKIKTAMEEYNKMPIANVEPARVVDRKALEAALATKGVKLEDMRADEIMELVKSIPDIRIKITREGSTGYEEYRFVKGEVFSTKIKNKQGEILELSDEELNQEIAIGPPKEFQTWEIDYSLPKEKLYANYRMAILHTKSECGWTKLDFKIKDAKTIVIKRLDSKHETTIERIGSTWSLENYPGSYTLFQALVLANLTNKVHGIFVKEGHVGGSAQPFSLDGDNVDFDKTWNPIDLRILAAETNWLSFYDKIGVSKSDVVRTLNAWYKAEYKAYADKL